jgi:AcrR family transcriptional regulator
MEEPMDRRQRKTREAIFQAFTELLAEKYFDRITVGEIIARADIGRATFYAHFETKDHLLKELCDELFCHIFDSIEGNNPDHRHIFQCDDPDSGFLHLLRHLQKNDNHILDLLSCRNNDLFLTNFRTGLLRLIRNQLPFFAPGKAPELPEAFWVEHIAATFVQTIRWWIDHKMEESPERIVNYFFLSLHIPNV